MVRHLGGRPHSLSLPSGYSLRWYRDGDREVWLRIQESTGIYAPVAPDLFDREFGELPELLPQRQCFMEDSSGAAVGTATAWVAASGRASAQGRVHWVAVSPDHQRRGIGSYLTEMACSRLHELGANSAYLTTGPQNSAAIQLYLGLGFRPEIASPADLSVWETLAPALEPRFRKQLEGLAV